MLFSIEVLRARKGDCLMLQYGRPNDPHLVIIDGGPRKVYLPHLKPRIQQIRTRRRIPPGRPLPVDLVLVSHVDDDHIQGLLDLTREMITAQDERRPQLIQVLSFWHNSFDNIIDSTPTELTSAFKERFGSASMEGVPPTDLTLEYDDAKLDEETIESTLKVLASIEQGARLRHDANRLQWPLNPEFEGGLIMANSRTEPIEMGTDLNFTVAGPMLPELKMLHAKHQAWLNELRKKNKSPEEVLSAYVDPSVTNLSSLVLLAEAGDKRILLTGDARGDKILQGLQLSGLLSKGPDSNMHVDVLKVPHHGSSNNLTPDFFQRVTADHYVFSGNGEHGNPERESLEMLFNARGEGNYKIYLTYPIAEIDKARKADWVKEQTKQKKRKEKNPGREIEIRPNWSPRQHSLTAFFEAHKNLAKRVSIVEEGQPRVIDLLDKLGF